MAVNLATKFSEKTSELIRAEAKTSSIINNNWDWEGVNAVKAYTLVDPTVGNYTASGTSRYGTPTEVQDTVQTWTLARDRSWTNTIDMINYQDTLEIRKPAKYLAQAMKNVMIPEIDTYRLATLAAAGASTTNAQGTTITARNAIVTAGATTSTNAYQNFLALTGNMTDNECPDEGRVALMTSTYYNLLKQSGFVLNASNAYQDRKSGDLGRVDNCDVVIVPSTRMPAATDLIITHPSNLIAPEKLKDFNVHKNAPGINGYLLEYRHRYDAFFEGNRYQTLAIHKTS